MKNSPLDPQGAFGTKDLATFPIGRPGWGILLEKALDATICYTQKCLNSWYRVRGTCLSHFVWAPLRFLKILLESN